MNEMHFISVSKLPYTQKALLSMSICWTSTELIVVSTPSGTVCFGCFEGKDTKFEVISQEVHSKSLCTLCPVTPSNVILSTGIDRVFALWNVSPENHGLIRCHAAVAGFVYDLAFHPEGTGVLAVATGTGNVRVSFI